MNWKKALLIAADVVLGIYLVLAVTAFNKPDDATLTCQRLRISIRGGAVEGFLTNQDVERMLKDDHLDPRGLALGQVNTRQIEEHLQAKELIDEAQCYTTQDGSVCISISQRIPVVRVMAQNGDDYCVDSRGLAMPRSSYSCNLIVVTGYVTPNYAAKHLAPMANLILGDRFWRSQVVQLNVLKDGNVELIPRVGDHVVYLGQPVGLARKLERLRKFYLYGLSQAGWNKYSRISVEFDNQIICKRK